MNSEEYERMKNELKSEFSAMVKSNHLNGIIDILKKHHPTGKPGKTDAQVLVVSEFIESGEKRGRFDPICTFSVSRDINGNYSGVAFGIIPSGTLVAKMENR